MIDKNYIILPKRGLHKNMPTIFENEGEIIYITDMNLFCIVNNQCELQLMAKVVDYESKDMFPIEPNKDEVVKLYNALDEDILYYYDIQNKSYEEVTMNYNSRTHVISVKE